MKKQTIFIAGIALLVIVMVIILTIIYFVSEKKGYKDGEVEESSLSVVKKVGCLGDDEIASYENDKSDFVGKIQVIVKGKENNEIISDFQIGDVMLRNYHPIELYKCGVYVLKSFNDDYKLSKALPGFSKELWFYNYKGIGKKIIILAGESEKGVSDVAGVPGKLYVLDYSYDFRVDPKERYLVLGKSYLGKDDYALVIKDLSTLEDVFVLNLKKILSEHPDVIPGSFGFGAWINDGKYLRGDIFQGALNTAFYQVEAGTWKLDIFATPFDILAGVERAINFNNWRLAYVDIPTFTGIQEVYEQIIKEAKEKGQQKNLFIYNLRTKEKIKVASADPEWRFNLKWLSDTELQYELPSGEKKIYKIQE